MATQLTVFSSNHTTGLDVTANASAADGSVGNKFLNSGGQTLIVINAGGAPCIITKIYSPSAQFDGTTPANQTVSVPAGHTMEIGPFPPGLYNDTLGFFNFQYNQVTSVTVLARALGN